MLDSGDQVPGFYPQDQLIALRRQNAEAQAAQPVATVALPSIENLNFRYRIEGDHPPGDQTGRQIVGRSLNIQPTLTVRPGFPVRVILTRDLVLEPYSG